MDFIIENQSSSIIMTEPKPTVNQVNNAYIQTEASLSLLMASGIHAPTEMRERIAVTLYRKERGTYFFFKVQKPRKGKLDSRPTKEDDPSLLPQPSTIFFQ